MRSQTLYISVVANDFLPVIYSVHLFFVGFIIFGFRFHSVSCEQISLIINEGKDILLHNRHRSSRVYGQEIIKFLCFVLTFLGGIGTLIYVYVGSQMLLQVTVEVVSFPVDTNLGIFKSFNH